jgi:hypothetical protein
MLIARQGTVGLQQDACKINCAAAVIGFLNAFHKEQPWQSGVHMSTAAAAVTNGMSGFPLGSD